MLAFGNLINISPLLFHSDGSEYLHGSPTNDVYTIDFKAIKMHIIASLVVINGEGITGMSFLAAWHSYMLKCVYGPIGETGQDYQVKLGAITGFYGNINEQGITTLGYHGCKFTPTS